MEKNQPILDGIDPDITDRLVTRRDAIRKGATASAMLTWGLSLGSVPVALAAMSKEAFAQGGLPQSVVDVLKFAFILENLENEFYKAVLDIGGTSNTAQRAAFATVRALAAAAPQPIVPALQQIQKHEQQHVDFLKAALGTAAPTITANDFDFTGGNGAGNGPFAAATTNLDFLLLAAQAFEDTGVRAYKGQVGILFDAGVAADTVLEDAVRIHATEARHAAKIRRVRRQRNTGDTTLRFSGYVRGTGLAAAGSTANITPAPPTAAANALAAVYGGATPEGNTTHQFYNDVTNQLATLDVTTLTGLTMAGGDTLAEVARMAFDEPLTKEEVIAIVGGFIKDDAARGLP